MSETELYEPIKKLLEFQGYVVRGEVGVIDIFAMKGETSIAVELKNHITLKLVYQAIDRQKIADYVYIAIPKSAQKSHQSSYRSFMLLLRRLSIGLMIVEKDQAQVILDAKDYDMTVNKKRNKQKKLRIINEFSHLESQMNLGGSRGKKMTVYREKAIKIANAIEKYGTLSPKSIKEMTLVIETASILQKNYYGWFTHISRGQYGLSESGLKEIRKYNSNL
ncbi:MAG: hypothetical protein KKG64_01710 [Firmicutes bacterium]|nr:hypothetical protein [Bacillota bacterium]